MHWTAIVTILLGTLTNEKVIAQIFSPDGSIENPKFLWTIRVLNLFLVSGGFLILKYRRHLSQSPSLLHLFYVPALLCGWISLGGIILNAWIDRDSLALIINSVLLIFSAIVLGTTGSQLKKIRGKKFIFANILIFFSSLITFTTSELLARILTPPWPAMTLHGVQPNVGGNAWGRATQQPGSIGFNSWGQRDRERSLHASKYRIALVGDSFLEESTVKPLSVVTENLLIQHHPDLEVINLGVSATAPDEYFYRIKNLAPKLGVRHVVLCFYTGNDFISQPTLRSFLGIIATYPRDSLFSQLGLLGLNHQFTNRFRPILGAWGSAGELNQRETDLWKTLVRSSDEGIPIALSEIFQLNHLQKADLQNRFAKNNMAQFCQILRNPDQNLFRSYYLIPALMQQPRPMINENTFNFTYRWISRSKAFCDEQGINFTLMIIPEAFQVDHRMQEQWRPMADMKTIFTSETTAAKKLADQSHAQGIHTLDLHPLFSGKSGTYLNMDGHWSSLGVNLAAEALAHDLEKSKRP